MTRLAALLTASLLAAAPAAADEGMWLFNNFPGAKVKAKYGFEPSQQWLDTVRLASVRIAGGCSASVVSPDGLVLTNHHCARSCVQQLSTPKKDLMKAGYLASSGAQELKCPTMELNQLVDIKDVTKRVQEATAKVPAEKFVEAQKAVIATIEKECATSDEVRCDVVNLYRGGEYDLYTYQRFQDVRLVFAPEEAIAFFGGDPDNFNFPRYDLDMSLLRIYGKDGKPRKMQHYLPFASEGPKDGDLTFVSGNPGGTSRTVTVSQLVYSRDVKLPERLFRYSELRGLLTEYQHRGAEQKRHSQGLLFGIENAIKAYKGRHAALVDAAFFGSLEKAEAGFRAKVNAKPELKAKYASAWDDLDKAMALSRSLRVEYGALESGNFFAPTFGYARALLRWGDEGPKANTGRLPEFTDSKLPALKMKLGAKTPVYDEFDAATLAWSLTKMREDLSPDHPVVKKVLGNKSPEEVAKALVKGTKLKDPAVRMKLFEGGKAAIDKAKDPMIEFVRLFDAEARAVRKRLEDEVEGPAVKAAERIAAARFAIYGKSIYPDATFTLRLSYGAVKGWTSEGTRQVTPFTTLEGAFERHTGREPFALPKSWLAGKAKLDLATPFNLVTTNDIIGGNSGSPLINQKGEIVGLVFDGNIHSLGGDYGFDENLNRTVAVHHAAMIETLKKIYGGKRLVDELTASQPTTTGQK